MSGPQHTQKPKVCIVSISLANGGAERSTALLSKMLEGKGYPVTIALVNNQVTYPYAGKLYPIYKGPKRFGLLSSISGLLKFRSFLTKQQFDLIIDNRTRLKTIKESIYSGFLYKGFNVLYVVRSYKLANYFPASLKMVRKQAKRALGYVGVSKAIASHIKETYGIKKVYSVYNPVELESFKTLGDAYNVKGDYILAVGRLVESVKNFELLINSYAKSKLPWEGIDLKILGDGPDKGLILNLISAAEMERHIKIEPFNSNPFPYYKNAKCTCLTSHYEGFPRVLLESLAMGTPVVSVDCKSGPAEVINHGENGLLVPNYNQKAFSDALNSLIFDSSLYERCKANAAASVAHLDVSSIANQWDNLLQEVL